LFLKIYLPGLGFALSYSPSVVMVGIHFKKRRSLANGISLSGSGVGSFILPILIRWMLKEYGLSGCLLLLGGLMFNVCVCALLYRPLNSYSKKKHPDKVYPKDIKEKDTVHQHLMNEATKRGSLQLVYDDDSSYLQVKDIHIQTVSELNANLHVKTTSEFSSSEYLPIASLQSISQKEMQNISLGLCARLDCSKCKNKSKKQTQRKGPKLFNWSLLSNPIFLIYGLSCALGNFAYPNIFLMLPAYAESVSLFVC
jgi:MFS family permease